MCVLKLSGIQSLLIICLNINDQINHFELIAIVSNKEKLDFTIFICGM